MDRIKRLLLASRRVIRDCSLRNGAIVAANSKKTYFPKEAKNYRFVWPRDASYTCIAANLMGMRDIQEPFFNWCMRAEGWSETGLFYKNYHVNGKKRETSFQPDQNAGVLIALLDYFKDDVVDSKRFHTLISKTADGLSGVWDKNHFNVVTEDLWEERKCFPDLIESFTYSLAMSYRGLLCANELIPNKKWVAVAREMRETLRLNSDNYFFRSFGTLNDERVDASLIGLVWPTDLFDALDTRIVSTIDLIEEKLVRDFGIYRYEYDEYDGWMYDDTVHRKKGAGYWPLLNFWMVIYQMEKGARAVALKYYDKVLDDVGDADFIPEQIFDNDIQVSISPLCWSHSMFVIASKKLGYF